jgi:hypothetical protein
VGRKVIDGAEKHGVGQIRAGFGDDGEPRRGFDPAHGKGEGKRHEGLGGVGEWRKDEGELGDVAQVEPHPVEPVGEVDLEKVDGPTGGIGENDGVDDPGEGMSELHAFGRC